MMTKTTSNTPRTISVRRDRSFLRTEYELLCSDVSGTGRFDDASSGVFLATDALVVSLATPSLTRDSTPSIRIAHKPIQNILVPPSGHVVALSNRVLFNET